MSKEILRTRDLATRTGMSEGFWYKRRLRGDGPPFMMVGDVPLYDWDVVFTWLQAREQRSTSDSPAITQLQPAPRSPREGAEVYPPKPKSMRKPEKPRTNRVGGADAQ